MLLRECQTFFFLDSGGTTFHRTFLTHFSSVKTSCKWWATDWHGSKLGQLFNQENLLLLSCVNFHGCHCATYGGCSDAWKNFELYALFWDLDYLRLQITGQGVILVPVYLVPGTSTGTTRRILGEILALFFPGLNQKNFKIPKIHDILHVNIYVIIV